MDTKSGFSPAVTRHGDMFSDATTAAVWAALMTLDVAAQHEVLGRLRTRLATPGTDGGAHTTRIEQLVASVREALDLLVEQSKADGTYNASSPPQLSEASYVELSASNPQFAWPPASSMRRWVQGSWNDVLSRAMVATVDGGNVVVPHQSGSYTWEEVRDALLDFREHRRAKGLDPENFTYGECLSWAKLPAVRALPGRRPRSQAPYDLFGGFLVAKRAAFTGMTPQRSNGKRALRASGTRSVSGYGYSDDDLKAGVLKVVAFRNGVVPRAAEYELARQELLEVDASEAIASYQTLVARWRTWDATLVACGLPPFREVTIDEETGRGVPMKRRNNISDDELLAGVLEAFEAKGKPFDSSVYKGYIEQQGRRSKTGARLATYSCIYLRYREEPDGAWKHACNLALPAEWDQLDA